MLVTRFLLLFLGFYLCNSIGKEYDGCEYQVKVSIVAFQSDSLFCSWGIDIQSVTVSTCTFMAAKFPRWAKQVNITLLPNTKVATLTINFPAVNSSIPKINLEFQISNGSQKDVCTIKSLMENDHNKRHLKVFSGTSADGHHCSANLNVTSILHCSTTTTRVTPGGTTTRVTPSGTTTRVTPSDTTTQATPSGTTTSTIRTNIGENTTTTKEDSNTSTMATECLVLYIMMVVSYIVAIVTITVEIVMCCKMYERTTTFPWFKVHLTETVVPNELKAEKVSIDEESVTMTSEQMNNMTQSDCSWTCGSEDQDQQIG